MLPELEVGSRNFWDKRWGKLLRHHGMIAPSGKLIQWLVPWLTRGALVLDLGCGEGRNTIYLTRIGFRGVGMDLSFKGVKVLANNLFEEEVKAICLVGDACSMPFPNERFNGILAHNLFDYLDKENMIKAFSEAHRVLAPSGVMLATFDPPPKDVPSKHAEIKSDGTIVYFSGPNKGMIFRPFVEAEFRSIVESGWKILKEDFSPRGSKIVLLQKSAISSQN